MTMLRYSPTLDRAIQDLVQRLDAAADEHRGDPAVRQAAEMLTDFRYALHAEHERSLQHEGSAR
jgi:hypothetical protein